ncbi:hypothetical protein LTR78_004242 [Recurvomyces mirabilis]|uniref:Small ribosomal subunit protein uS7m n=1 Tax=Recurvomyces mirabilis TaxID=574656 RepID=A0AAE0WQI4_9PEZI|nr:hypothetical protein LTR78_004242 [Recurvomyces mirabilis]KAK5153588.1 hypothetical protein LTS14_007282 [Recurvomyces mirabilis]
MPPLNPISAARALAFRPHVRATASIIGVKRPATTTSSYRAYATNPKHNALPQASQSAGDAQGEVGPNMQQQEHVSEEQAKMDKIMGKEGPDMDVGTPVQEILADEKDIRKTAPQVIKDSIKSGEGAQNAKPSLNPNTPGSSRSFSTFARRRVEAFTESGAADLDPSMLPSASQRASYAQLQEQQSTAPQIVQEEKKGHKFPLPTLPLPSNAHLKHRHDPVVLQVTNLMMIDGKKSVAERNMAHILTTLRTAPAPTYNPSRPLLPGAPPASHLPLHPVLYLTLALDSVAPLLRIRSQRGAAGGGVALQIPVPLGLRQRRRTAFTWILDAASKRKSRGSGRDGFATRVAEEIISVVEGKSGVWEKRAAVHRLGTTARSNLMGRGRR